MKIAVTSQDAKGNFKFFPNGPWNEFKVALLEEDHKVVDLEQEPDAIICNNYSPRLYKHIANIPLDKRVIIFWESPTTWPQMFDSKVINLFGARFFPSPIWAHRYHGENFSWPQSVERHLIENSWNSRFSKFCMISSNHFSFVKPELYSLRRQVIRHSSSLIDLYGHGWNKSKFFKLSKVLSGVSKGLHSQTFKLWPLDLRLTTPANYIGAIEHKTEVLSKYKYSLVIENHLEYVTEKVFDSILSGCITVYVGPPLEQFGIPKEVCIPASNNLEELSEVLKNLPNDIKRISAVRQSMHEFLGSPGFFQHHNSYVLRNLGKRISGYLQSRES